jgi:signal peptidase I
LERGDIVVFKYPRELSKDFVKRAVALEGETVEIRNKQIFLDGRPVEEDYKLHRDARVLTRDGPYASDDYIRDQFGPIPVPPGHVFVMGDNRDNSMDSRYWGFLPVSYLKGRPWMIYFSFRSRDSGVEESGKGEKILGILPKPRFNRLFHIIH